MNNVYEIWSIEDRDYPFTEDTFDNYASAQAYIDNEYDDFPDGFHHIVEVRRRVVTRRHTF